MLASNQAQCLGLKSVKCRDSPIDMTSTGMRCVILYLPSLNGYICHVYYEISPHYLCRWSFCLMLKAGLRPDLQAGSFPLEFGGFVSPLCLDSLTIVCLSVSFYFAFIQISGLVQPSHGCPERKVAWWFLFFSFGYVSVVYVCAGVLVCDFLLFYLAVIHGEPHLWCVSDLPQSTDLPLKLVVVWKLNRSWKRWHCLL